MDSDLVLTECLSRWFGNNLVIRSKSVMMSKYDCQPVIANFDMQQRRKGVTWVLNTYRCFSFALWARAPPPPKQRLKTINLYYNS